ncbi:MAG: hypothetical protein ACREDM_12000 [Methylocella sp.]
MRIASNTRCRTAMAKSAIAIHRALTGRAGVVHILEMNGESYRLK